MANTKHGEIQMLLEKAAELDWVVTHESDNVFMFSKYSPAGQDFNICIDTEGDPDYFLKNLLSAHEDFDVSEEAYIWLGSDGHGENGAPYDMKDVYEDMEACESAIYELFETLHDYYHKEIYKEDD